MFSNSGACGSPSGGIPEIRLERRCLIWETSPQKPEIVTRLADTWARNGMINRKGHEVSQSQITDPSSETVEYQFKISIPH